MRYVHNSFTGEDDSTSSYTISQKTNYTFGDGVHLWRTNEEDKENEKEERDTYKGIGARSW